MIRLLPLVFWPALTYIISPTDIRREVSAHASNIKLHVLFQQVTKKRARPAPKAVTRTQTPTAPQCQPEEYHHRQKGASSVITANIPKSDSNYQTQH